MMQTPLRYARAFFKALALTLRGQKPPSLEAEARYAGLRQWSRETVDKLNAVNRAVQQHGVETGTIVKHIEGRDVSLEHALSVIHFHATREYPHLIRSGDRHTNTAIHALNMNDQYLIQQMSEHKALPEAVQRALGALTDHLVKIVKE